MALIKCKECNAEISDKAVSCPKCGCPNDGNFKNIKNESTDNILKETTNAAEVINDVLKNSASTVDNTLKGTKLRKFVWISVLAQILSGTILVLLVTFLTFVVTHAGMSTNKDDTETFYTAVKIAIVVFYFPLFYINRFKYITPKRVKVTAWIIYAVILTITFLRDPIIMFSNDTFYSLKAQSSGLEIDHCKKEVSDKREKCIRKEIDLNTWIPQLKENKIPFKHCEVKYYSSSSKRPEHWKYDWGCVKEEYKLYRLENLGKKYNIIVPKNMRRESLYPDSGRYHNFNGYTRYFNYLADLIKAKGDSAKKDYRKLLNEVSAAY